MKKRFFLPALFLLALACAPSGARACIDHADCDDLNPCTVDTCVEGVCENDSAPMEGQLCDDQDPCTMDDTCLGGVCGGDPLDEDGDTYVSDACLGDDCDDGDPDINPGATEGPDGDATCLDGVDNECDGAADLEDPGCVPCVDSDQDGYGEQASENCDHPEEDCEDGNPNINPGVLEGPPATPTCADGKDNDCDGLVDKYDEFCIGSVTWVTGEEAEASQVGPASRTQSKASNLLALLLVPIGIVITLKALYRKK